MLHSNNSPVHDADFGQSCANAAKCRICQIHELIAQCSLKPMSDYGPIKIAIGLAVPAIEAWYLCGSNPNVSEGAWIRGMQEDRYPYTKKQLKEFVYGTDRPSLAIETERAVAETQRVAQDLEQLKSRFRRGFGWQLLRSSFQRVQSCTSTAPPWTSL